MSVRVSIVVPIFNIEEYLDQCIQSIIGQTYSDLEILLVDDGSTDESGAMCDKYAKIDKRIQTIHQENGGLSAARNTGTKRASGEFIYYVDGDDWIHPQTIEKCVTHALKHGLAFVESGYQYVYDSHIIYHKQFKKSQIQILTRDQSLKALLNNDYIKNFAWGSLIKRQLATEIQFPEGKFFEDIYWKHAILNKCDKAGFLRCRHYNYRQRANGISGAISKKHIDLILGSRKRIAFIKTHSPSLHHLALKNHWLLTYSLYEATKALKDKELIVTLKKALDDATEYCKENTLGHFRLVDNAYSLEYICFVNFPSLLPLVTITRKLLSKLIPSKYKQESYSSVN